VKEKDGKEKKGLAREGSFTVVGLQAKTPGEPRYSTHLLRKARRLKIIVGFDEKENTQIEENRGT